MTNITSVWALAGWFICAGFVCPVADGQASESQHDVQRPPIGGPLKAGWQLHVHNRRRFATPVSSSVDADGSLAIASAGSHISIRLRRITNWSAHKAQIRAAFGPVPVVHEDSNRRLWFGIGEEPSVRRFVDVTQGVSVCAGLIGIRATTTPDADDTRHIAESIGPTPESRP
jgi:hypothetical protein